MKKSFANILTYYQTERWQIHSFNSEIIIMWLIYLRHYLVLRMDRVFQQIFDETISLFTPERI